MKQEVKFLLQKLVGYDNYLQAFSLFKIFSLKHQAAERDFVKFMELLPQEGKLIDIGANIGLMTINLARKFQKSTIYSFEPIPFNSRIIRRNLTIFDLSNVKLSQMALGNKTGFIEMVVPEVQKVKMHGLCHVVDSSIPKQSHGERFIVPLKRLDEIEEFQTGLPVTGIKIDVEHFEWAVLEGAQKIIERYKPIIYCELANNENRIKSFDILTKLNYQAHIVENDKIVLFDNNKHKGLNFIFINTEN